MTTQKYTLDLVEFYITNVCNLSCTNCNRFNNLKLKGFQKWEEYKHKYEIFANRLDIKRLSIIGGEPFLNPDIYNWIHGLIELWPNGSTQITTNGTRPQDKRLLDTLIKYKGKLWIDYECHDEKYYNVFHNSILKFFPNCNYKIFWDIERWSSTYNTIRGADWPSEPIDITNENNWKWLQQELKEMGNTLNWFQSRIEYYIDNIKYAHLAPAWYFNNTAITIKDDIMYTEAKSNMNNAHNNCTMSKCHNFVNGELYKCITPYTLLEAVNQENVKISPQDYELLKKYQPLTVEHNDKDFKRFIDNIENPIDQCKFCPEFYTTEKISIVNKKSKTKHEKFSAYSR